LAILDIELSFQKSRAPTRTKQMLVIIVAVKSERFIRENLKELVLVYSIHPHQKEQDRRKDCFE
jgi:hypothetical protein